VLAEAAELGLAVARRDAASPGAPPPPAALRPLLRFRRAASGRALATTIEVLDADADFRARVAGSLDETAVGPVTRLFLVRPEGWREEFELLVAAEADELRRDAADREERSARRRLEQVEEALERMRDERNAAVEAVGRGRADLEREQARTRDAEERVVHLEEELRRAVEERRVAVQQLGEARATAEDRLRALREVEAARAAGATGAVAAPAPVAPGPDPAEAAAVEQVRRSVGRASELADRLGRALDDALRELDELDGPGSRRPGRRAPGAGPADAPADGPGLPDTGPAIAPERVRRRPVRLQRGATEGSTDGVEQLFRLPEVLVLVDGYNVSMAGWPDLDKAAQRDRLVSVLSDARARTGADVRVVFDGGEVGRRPAVTAALPVRIHFSPVGVEADDVVLDMVTRAPVSRPVVVVSDDRRVRDGARRLGANVVGVATLLEWSR
jgi:hypothetical protein